MTILFGISSLITLMLYSYIGTLIEDIDELSTEVEIQQQSRYNQYYNISLILFTLSFILMLLFYFLEPYIISSDTIIIKDDKVLSI